MSKILVPPEVILRVSEQFAGASEHLGMMTSNLNIQISMMMFLWDGTTQRRFFDDFQKARSEMKLTVEHLQVISQELKRITYKFLQVDGENGELDPRCAPPPENACPVPPIDETGESNDEKTFADQAEELWEDVQREAEKAWEGVKSGVTIIADSVVDTGVSLYEDPIGTLGDMAYNATIGTAEEIIGTVAWGGKMIFDAETREGFKEGTKEEVEAAGGWSAYLGQQAAVMIGGAALHRAGIKGKGPQLQKHDDLGGRESRSKDAEGTGEVASRLISGKGIYTQYSGGLKQAAKEDAGADLLAEKLDGQSRMIFNNDPKGREFDVISDQYIGQTKTSMNSLSSQFREQAKATIEAAIETGRQAYFHFESAPADKVIRQLREYEKRYNVEIIIDISPF